MYDGEIISLPLDDDYPFDLVPLDYIEGNNEIDSDACDYHLMDRVAVESDAVDDNFIEISKPVDQSIAICPNYHQDEENIDIYDRDDTQFTDIDSLPKSIAGCVKLNEKYLESLIDFKNNLEEKLQANLMMQQELLESQALANDHIYPNSLLKFLAPYFRDRRDYAADDNDDTKSRKATGCINPFYLRYKKPWKDSDKLYLTSSVQNCVDKKELEPLTIQKNNLLAEINKLKSQEASQDIIDEKTDKMKTLDDQIELVRSVSNIPSREHSEDIDWLEVAQNCPSLYDEFDCEIRWTNFEHPEINHDKWSQKEDEELKSLTQRFHYDWDKIAKNLGTKRVAWQCCQRYQSKLSETIISSGRFTKEESKLLYYLIDKLSVGDHIPWTQVRYFMGSRSLPQIKNYYNKSQILRRGAKWTELEDKVLLAAVRKCGVHKWKSVAEYIPGRSNMQCRERYMLRLGIKDRKLGNWTFFEDLKLVSKAPKENFRWVDVMAHLTKRNPRQIAARYDTIEKHRVTKTIETSKDLRDLVPRNRPYGKPPPNLEFVLEEGQSLDDFLREGKKQLEIAVNDGTYRAKLSRPGVGGRKKKPETEERIEQQLIQQFSLYSLMGKISKPTKKIARVAQQTMLFDVLENILTDYFDGKLPDEPHLLSKVISSVLRKQVIGVNTEKLNHCPPIFPPNIITTQSYQVLLNMRAGLKQQLADYNYDTSQHVWDSNYRTLVGLIVSLYFWPCLLSKNQPKSMKPPSDSTQSTIPTPPTESSSSSSSLAICKPSKSKPKKRKKCQSSNIGHCNDSREKQRYLFKNYENYLAKSNSYED